MPSPWQKMPEDVPVDAQVVWVRRFGTGAPFAATWRVATQEFECAGGLMMPWHYAWAWKPYP